MKMEVAIVNAFVDGNSGGNPAGVVLGADELTNAQKLAIAQKVGLSETAFVSHSSSADFKLDFFTPHRQIAHCGHATIATFSYLAQRGLVPQAATSKETIDGNRNIYVEDDFAYMEQLAPTYTEIGNETDLVLESLGLSAEMATTNPVVANTGNSFMLAGVRDMKTLAGIKPDHQVIRKISEEYDLVGFFVFSLETNIDDRDASSRMFAPRYGINEESATGMAAGPLACYLYDYLNMDKTNYLIEQGYSMPTPSPCCIEVLLTMTDSKITSLMAGGTGVVSGYKQVEL